MKKGLLLLLILCLKPVSIAWSDCNIQQPLEKEWENTSHIFIGTVLEEVRSSTYNIVGQPIDHYNIVIDAVFKGDISVGNTITMFKHTIDHYRFRENNQYLIFAHSWGEFLSTNVCQRTCPIEDAQEIFTFLAGKTKK